MRHCSASWFVLGFFVPAVCLIVIGSVNALYHSGSGGRGLDPVEVLIATSGFTLAYLVVRLLSALLMPAFRRLGFHSCGSARQEEPHELFTPFYDQRRQEWVASRRRRMT